MYQDKLGRTKLYIASEDNNEEKVHRILKAAEEDDINKPDNDGCTPLFRACFNGHHLVVKMLLEANANIDQAANNDDTPIYAASSNGHQDIVQTLLREGAKDLHGWRKLSILHAASRYDHHDVVKVILNNEQGKQLLNDTSNVYNVTPLTWAILNECYNLDTIKLLIKAGADYNKPDNLNKTPFQLAVEEGKSDIAEYIMTLK